MLDMGSTEGAQGPSSDQRVSAMQLFWLHSCHCHQETQPQQVLAAKPEPSRSAAVTPEAVGCPLGDSWE